MVATRSTPIEPRGEERVQGEETQVFRDGFIRSLIELAERDDRAALARLRRTAGKGPAEAFEAYPYVAPYTERLDSWPEACRYLIAGLFALHPPKRIGEKRVERFSDENLGEAFARLAPRGSSRRDAVERRFTQLLAAGPEELPDQLRQAISLLQAGDVAVDWRKLLWNIERWQHAGHRVQREWARAFWQLPKREEEGGEEGDGGDTVTAQTSDSE